MPNPLQQTIEALAKEKGIEPDVVISAIEEAVATASRKYYKTGENLKTRFNTETGQVDLFALKQVVQEVTNPAIEIAIDDARQIYQQLYGDDVANSIELSDEMEFPKPTEVLGRIAAQTAKQVIFQKVREAERENIFAEYNQRIGEVVNGTVKRFENGDMILEVGRVEAVLPRKEQSRAESYSPSDRVRTVIKGVNRGAKGPQIVLSRTDPALLIKLFEQEVPEIYDSTVTIRGAVREAGDRAKVAVYSRERDVDPVGACVGMKGTRVQSIIRELRGEKIDIVEWSEDPIAFVTNALSPAKVQRVSIVDDRERVMEVIVEDRQLSLAIGKKGQNVRLAAKLTGWRIDIKSEEEKRREVEAQFEGLEGAPAPTAGSETPEAPTAGPEAPESPTAGLEAPEAPTEGLETSEAPTTGPEASGAAGDAASGETAGAPLLYTLAGVSARTVRKLIEAGYATVEAVAAASVEQLSEIPGVGDKTAERILASARGEATPEATE
jgi:N utilization substance protein A